MHHCDPQCIFCKIVNKEIPSKVISENDYALAFMDVNPICNGHCLVIPKAHFCDLEHTDDDYLVAMIKLVKEVAHILAYDKQLDPWGFNYLSNQGDIAGQVVKHTHIHILPKYAKGEGFEFGENKKHLEPIEDVYESIMHTKQKMHK